MAEVNQEFFIIFCNWINHLSYNWAKTASRIFVKLIRVMLKNQMLGRLSHLDRITRDLLNQTFMFPTEIYCNTKSKRVEKTAKQANLRYVRANLSKSISKRCSFNCLPILIKLVGPILYWKQNINIGLLCKSKILQSFTV